MKCPKCGCSEDKVVETRVAKEGEAIRRRRECLGCGYRFNTREGIVMTEFVVIKRDGTREDFDPEKVRSGIRHATWKRQVTQEQIDTIVADVTAQLIKRAEREVPTRVVGELVMSELQDLDEVAYVRFASVYRRFEGAGEFIDEVHSLVEAQHSREEDSESDG